MTSADPKTYLWANIEALMGGEKQTIDAVQARTKVSRGTIQRIKAADTSIGTDRLVEIAEAFNVDVSELLRSPSQLPRKQSRSGELIDLDNNPDYPAIPYVNFKLSAGASGFGVDYDAESSRILVFGKDWYASRHLDPEKLFAVKVCNGSMEPGLYDKDTVVVNTADTVLKDGMVFAMNFEGELVIKRMVRDGGQWWLASDNADKTRYPRKICDENVFPVGRIVHKQSERI